VVSAIKLAVIVPAHRYFFNPRRARDQEIAWQHAPPGFSEQTSSGNIAAGPAHALPRYRLRQHLGKRSRPIDGIRVKDAVAVFRNLVAGLDPKG
jgi:hypothetical protein